MNDSNRPATRNFHGLDWLMAGLLCGAVWSVGVLISEATPPSTDRAPANQRGYGYAK